MLPVERLDEALLLHVAVPLIGKLGEFTDQSGIPDADEAEVVILRGDLMDAHVIVEERERLPLPAVFTKTLTFARYFPK